MTEKDRTWFSKRFNTMEKRFTNELSRLRLQVEHLEVALGQREEGELRGAFELTNEQTGEVVERTEKKISTEGHQWTLDASKIQAQVGEPVWDSEHGDLRKDETD